MTDRITILTAVSGARMTKKWNADGTISQYDLAKTFDVEEREVYSLASLAFELNQLESRADAYIIRGAYPPDKRSRVERNTLSTFDDPHHWCCIDVDDYEPLCSDFNSDPLGAVQEFILDCLPAEFHDRSFFWQLSSSAGHPTAGGNVKAHLFFWLAEPVGSEQLREWAKRTPKVDPSTFKQVQPIYTARPVVEAGAALPPGRRSGLVEGVLGDEVDVAFLGAIVPISPTASADGSDIDIGTIKGAVSGYDADRVESELLAELDPDMPHDDWVMLGMALHHQFDGSDEALELWDTWSSTGSSWREGVCAERWPSFKGDRAAGSVTLRYLIKTVKDKVKESGSAAPVAKKRQPGLGHSDGALFGLATLLGRGADATVLSGEIDFNPKRFDRCVSRLAWDPARGQFTIMPQAGDMLQSTAADIGGVLRTRDMLDFVDVDKLLLAVRGSAPWIAAGATARAELEKAALGYLLTRVLGLVKAYRQFTTISAEVDMFEPIGGMRMVDGALRLVYPHGPLVGGEVDPALIADYREHFPELDRFMDLVVASRFATDRKKAHLWLHADSNWGKSFLCGMLKRHGLVIETSAAEIEKVMAGGPAGLTLSGMRRCWVLAVDEFKGVSRELKQLSTELTFSPKNQARVTVPLFLKLFMSAEDVPSLLSEETGADVQFNNRFMRLRLTGSMTVRPVYAGHQAAYVESVSSWMAHEINRRVDAYVMLGRLAAAATADAVLMDLHGAWPLSVGGRSLDDMLPELARQFSDDMVRAHLEAPVGRIGGTLLQRIAAGNVVSRDHRFYIQRAANCLDQWIDAVFPKSEALKVRYKRARILALLGERVSFRSGGAAVKAVPLDHTFDATSIANETDSAFL